MRSRLVLAALFGLVSSSAFGAAGDGLASAAPQGAITLTPTATLTQTPSVSASPTLTFTASPPLTGCGDCGGGAVPGPPVPTLSPGMLALLALGLATFAILRIRRL